MKFSEIDKVIVIDWMVYLKMSAYASMHTKMAPTYIAMTMILGDLKRVGVTPDTVVMVACDHEGSWRKEFITATKEDRKEQESEFQKNLPSVYKDFDELKERLKKATNWHILQYSGIEADDWFGCAVRYFSVFGNVPTVALTIDSDMSQLWRYDNFMWYSPHKKVKGFKVKPPKFNIHKHLAKEINTAGHNNLGIPKNEDERKIKELCVDLTKQPQWVKNECFLSLQTIEPRGKNPQALFSKTLIERYNNLYFSEDVMTYEQCEKKQLKKKLKKKSIAKTKKDVV